ncbi:MAG: NGG1p interacting factor NIF3, partial [Nitrospirota bacterium]
TTIVGMHIGEDHRKEAEKHHVNVVIAGHISSDNLGVNLMLDELSRQEPLRVYECSGFKRVSRL